MPGIVTARLRTLVYATVLLCLSSHRSFADDASGPPALDAVPKAYRIGLTINPAETRFTGHVEIDVDLTTPRQLIRLGGRDLLVTGVAAKSAEKTLLGTYKQVDDAGHAQINFESPLPAGRVTLIFDYSAPFQNGPGGLFRAQVDGDWYVWSELFPNPRRAYPSIRSAQRAGANDGIDHHAARHDGREQRPRSGDCPKGHVDSTRFLYNSAHANRAFCPRGRTVRVGKHGGCA